MSRSVPGFALCMFSASLLGCAHAVARPDAPYREHPTDASDSGYPDFLVCSPEWPYPSRRGKVVLFSGRTLLPLVTKTGSSEDESIGVGATIVPDCDHDGDPDFAYVVSGLRGRSGTTRIDVCSGRTGRILRVVPCGAGLESAPVVLAPLGDAHGTGVGVLLAGIPYASHGGMEACGVVRSIALDSGEIQSEWYGNRAHCRFGYHMVSIGAEGAAAGSLVLIQDATGWTRSSLNIVDGHGAPRRASLDPDSWAELRDVSGISGRMVRLGAGEECSTVLFACPSASVEASATDRVYAYEARRDASLSSRIQYPAGEDCGQAIAASADENRVLKGIFVGVPVGNGGVGCVWFHRSMLDAEGRKLTAKNLVDHFGETLVEIGDVDHDGVSDVVAIGSGMGWHAERGFEVLSGADGALHHEWLPSGK